jgi:16S rRNA (cytosine1402-N4)-methyltransferase
MKQKKTRIFHQPALLKETIEFLNIKPGEVYIDATVGGAGHSLAILKKGGSVFGLDCDPEAVNFAKKRLCKACSDACCQIIKENFVNLKNIVREHQVQSPAGILFDLGVSFHQFMSKGRGFSFLQDEALDMRMDPKLSVTAADLVNGLHKGELNELFFRLGEEKLALPIVRAVILARKREPIKTTKQLASMVSRVYEKRYKTKSKIHPATKVFLSLRIAVNDELNNLKKALPQAVEVLKTKGRLVVISFHGLEDKIVKNFFRKGEEIGWLKVLTKKPVLPSEEELSKNPRCRSAKLRCVQKN